MTGMLTEEEIREQLFDQYPVMFRQSIYAHNYTRARNIVDTARKVALFIQLPEKDLDELFGIRGDRGVVLQEGLFPEELVLKCDNEVRKLQYEENRKMMELIRERNKKDA